jgi:hypothetical protein
MTKTLSKGPDWHSTWQIYYVTVMSELRHVDGKTGFYVLHKSCSLMY